MFFTFAIAQNDTNNSTRSEINATTYSPSFHTLKTTEAGMETKDYQMINKIITDVEKLYLKRVITQMEQAKIYLDKRKPFYGKNYQFESSVDYYEVASTASRDNNNLYMGVTLLRQAREKFLLIQDALAANNIDEKDLITIEYKLKKYNAMFHMFKGEEADIKIAIRDFKYIIDKRIAGKSMTSIEDEIEILTYITGCHHVLYKKHAGNVVLSRYHLQYELYYLWILTEERTKDNEGLKKYKLGNLIKKYYDVVDIRQAAYRDHYKPYFDELAEQYVDIRTEAKDNAVDNKTEAVKEQ
jgi:hypothetical protein